MLDHVKRIAKIRHFLIVLALFANQGCVDGEGPSSPIELTGDATDSYWTHRQTAERDFQSLQSWFQRHHVVFVGGSFQDIRSDYFQAFKEVMGEASVTFSTVVVHPQGGGWKQLRTYMDPESTKLIVISHGVGSNYVAELLAHSNEAHNNIQLWLSLQGAFTGSRLAVTGEREKLSPVALQLVNQDPIGLHPQQRLDFFNKYGGQVDGQLKYIPTITVGTYKKATSHLNSPLASSRELVDSGNIYNDGFVAEGGSQWPGVPHIKLEGYDHLDTVLYSESTKDEQKLMLKTLLMMLWRMK